MIRIQKSKIDQTQFRILEGKFGDLEVFLVNPKSIKIKWTKQNLKYRSSIWTSSGEPISLGLPKFFNWDEGPNLRPAPSTMEDVNVVEKVDGSCLIVSGIPGVFGAPPIIRTRGTFNAFDMPNGHELIQLQRKYPAAFNGDALGFNGESYIFEWLSPENQIIVPVTEPDLRLIAVVRHDDYSLYTQDELDALAKQISVPRPRRYHFDTLQEMCEAVAALEGSEGVCVYYNNDQWIRKLKSLWYLALHRMKSDLGTIERVVEVYFAMNKPSYTEFMAEIENTFDFEIIEMARGHISRVCDGMKEVNKIIEGMHKFVEKMNQYETNAAYTGANYKEVRKLQAKEIISSYGKTNRAGYVFTLLDQKPLEDDALKKLLWQVLKK